MDNGKIMEELRQTQIGLLVDILDIIQYLKGTYKANKSGGEEYLLINLLPDSL